MYFKKFLLLTAILTCFCLNLAKSNIQTLELQTKNGMQLVQIKENNNVYLPQESILMLGGNNSFEKRYTRNLSKIDKKNKRFVNISGNMSFNNMVNTYIKQQGYKVYRSDNRRDFGFYEPVNVVKGYDDEILTEITYPDIMPEYGDRACIEEGTDVVINVIDTGSYTAINVYKDNVLIDTKSTIEDFTMSDIAAGAYKFELTDGTNTSESTLIVADVNGTYDAETHKVTFESSNATPVFVAAYAISGTNKGVQNKVKYFTAEEKSQGWADVSSIISATYSAVQIGFLTEYGVAMWWSTKLTDEWEYWSLT